jgi:hypothetical protein
MFALDDNTGRILLVRLVSPMVATEVDDLFLRIRLSTLKCPTRIVLFTDCTKCTVLDPETAAHASALFTRGNPKVERSAFLLFNRQGSLGMQLGRLFHEARNPERRLFDDQSKAFAFVDPVLDVAERAALRYFMRGMDAG